MRDAVPATKPIPHELLVNAAGGLLTTPSDYVRLMALMMEEAQRQPWQISERSRRAMLSRQLEIGGRDFYRGLGWQREDPTGMVIFEHSGSNSESSIRSRSQTPGRAMRSRSSPTAPTARRSPTGCSRSDQRRSSQILELICSNSAQAAVVHGDGNRRSRIPDPH